MNSSGQRRGSPAQRSWLLAANAVQGETIGNFNIPAVLEYRVKTTTRTGPLFSKYWIATLKRATLTPAEHII